MSTPKKQATTTSTSSSKVHVVNLSSYTTPNISEVQGKDWVQYGDDNNYFQYLIDRADIARRTRRWRGARAQYKREHAIYALKEDTVLAVVVSNALRQVDAVIAVHHERSHT